MYKRQDIFLPFGSINDSGTDLVIHGTNAVVLKTDGGTAITIPNNSTDINLGSGKLNFSRTSEAILLDSAHSKTKIGLFGGIGTGAEYIGTSANTVEISGTNINFNGASGSGTPNLKMGTTTVIDSSRNLTNIASLNMNTGSAVAVPKTFNIANTGGNSNRYIKFGTLSNTSQDGRSLKITVHSNAGYNAADSQNQETIIRFKTSNNNSNQSGFYGDCQKYDFGNNVAAPSTVLVKQVSTTEFEFYGLFSNFTGASSFYTVEHRHGTWTHDGTDIGTTAPTGTVLTATERVIFTSGSENQSATIKVGGITHGASTVVLDGSRNLINIGSISSGTVTVNGEVAVSPSSGTSKVRLTSTGAGSEVFTVNGQRPGVSNTGFAIRNETDSRNDFMLDGDGNATFAGTISSGNINIGVLGTTATGILFLNGSTANKRAEIGCTNGNLHIDADHGNGIYLNWYGAQSATSTAGVYFGNANAAQVGRIDGSGNLTLSGTISSGKITTSGTGTAGAPTLDIINSSSNTFNHSVEVITPNLTAGENNIILIGKASSGLNAGYIGYKYSSAGSNANVLTFGHWGSDNLVNLTGDGKLGIGIENPSASLDVNGNVRIGATGRFQTSTNVFKSMNTAEDGALIRAAVSNASNPTFSNVDDTNTGMFFAAADQLGFTTGGSERMRIDSSGNIQMGTAATTIIDANRNIRNVASLSMHNNILRLRSNTDNNHFLQYKATGHSGVAIDGAQLQGHQGGELTTNNGGNNYSLRWNNSGDIIVRNTITAGGDITAFSDERLKDNIQTLDGKKALQMRGVSFIRDGKEGSGVIAQEIEEIAPELVLTADDEQGTKSVAYGNLVGYLIEAIKDQQDQIEYMKSEIKVLKEANNGNK